MPLNKKELSQRFNEILGTDIRWEKLSKKELEELQGLLSNPDVILQNLTKLGVEIAVDEITQDVTSKAKDKLLKFLFD